MDLKSGTALTVSHLVGTAQRFNISHKLILTAPEPDLLEFCRSLTPDIGTCLLVRQFVESDLMGLFGSPYIDMFQLSANWLSAAIVESAHGRRKLLCAWSVNSRSALAPVINWHLDAVVTNYPALIRNELEGMLLSAREVT